MNLKLKLDFELTTMAFDLHDLGARFSSHSSSVELSVVRTALFSQNGLRCKIVQPSRWASTRRLRDGTMSFCQKWEDIIGTVHI